MTNGQKMVVLLHSGKCPVGYKCLANDCVECMKLHTAQQKEK